MAPELSATELLPVYLADGSDLGAFLAQALSRSGVVTVVEGPSDAGKTTLLRAVMRHAHEGRVVDLALLADAAEADAALEHAGPLAIDHLDRLAGGTQFNSAYELLTTRLAPRLPRENATVLAVNDGWSSAFAIAYGGMSPGDVLRRAAPSAAVDTVVVAPYDDDQLTALAAELQVDVSTLDDPQLRLAGVLSLVASHGRGDEWNTGRIRAQSVVEWIAKGGGSEGRELRQALWSLAGRRALRGESGKLARSELFSRLGGRYATSTLGPQVGGPFHWWANTWSVMSPSDEDVAAAAALRRVVLGDERISLPVPVRKSVVHVMLDLARETREELLDAARDRLLEIRDRPHEDVGYLTLALGATLLAGRRTVRFEGCRLQGPDHQTTDRISTTIADRVLERLIELFEHDLHVLLGGLAVAAGDCRSAYGGDGRVWEATRRWARGLPLRALIEDAILEEIPADRPWRHEDVLDVAVTSATTIFMSQQALQLENALRQAGASTHALLADVWDGVNDGAWDQLLVDRQESLEGLMVLDDANHKLEAVDCGLQRAQFGRQDVAEWVFERCDLHLADLRSCRNVLSSTLSGSNWWSAMLAPHHRYQLMRHLPEDERLATWIAAPPWQNPYYTAPWPAPLEGAL